MPRMLVNIILRTGLCPILLFSRNLVGYGGKAWSLLTCQSLRLSTGHASPFFPCCENHAVDAGDFICLHGGKMESNHSLGVEDSWLNLVMASGPWLLKKHMRVSICFSLFLYWTPQGLRYLWLENRHILSSRGLSVNVWHNKAWNFEEVARMVVQVGSAREAKSKV